MRPGKVTPIDPLDGSEGAPSAIDCLAGGGQMGALMRAYDWSRSPLGPVESWPQSLRTIVSTCLNSRFPILVWWGPQLVKLYNDAYREILGSKHPSALGRPGREVWPEIWNLIGPMLDGVMTRGEATWSENIMLPLHRHGFAEECYFTFSYSPIRHEGGGIGGIFTAVTETTSQVLSERRLRTLRDLGERIGVSADRHALVGAAHQVLAANRADVPFTVAHLGGADGAVSSAGLATHVTRADGSSLATLPAVMELDALSSAIGVSLVVDGAAPPARAALLPLTSVDGRRRGTLVVGLSPQLIFDERYRDFLGLVAKQISAGLDTLEALEQTRARAEALAQIDRAKTAFFSNVSHEFRTPLTLMIGPTEDALASPERALSGESLVTVHRNALRLLKLVNTLLDFSRIEAGRAQARYVETDLAAVTTDLASAFRSAVEKAGLRYDVDCAPIAAPTFVDGEMWEKIVLNLISNAFKFTFEGGIRVGLRQVGERVELSVSDSGVGIAEHELARVFERFHRVEGARSRTHEGSGIGLALVRDLVTLHGGTIDVASKVGEGTTFTVSLPTGRAHLPAVDVAVDKPLASTAVGAEAFVAEALRWLPAPATAIGAAMTAPPAMAPWRSARVLVADDNADMRDYLARLLAPYVAVEGAADGVDALARLRAERFDLVLADVMMPRLDGFGLLRAIRADERLCATPVVMLSARAGEESRVEGLQAGADDYLAKPFSARELLARVQTHLELSRLRREAELQRERLRSLFEQAPAVIAVMSGPEHVFELANPSYIETIGGRQVVGRPVREALPELEGQGLFELLDRCYATGETVMRTEVPIKLLRRNGLEDTFWNFTWQPYRDADGRVAGIMSFAFDVTPLVMARRRAEALTAEVRSSQQALHESEEQFRTLADSLPLLAWYANPDGYIPWYNQRWYEYTGATLNTRAGWQGQSVVDPDDVERVRAKWRQALASGEPWEDQFRLRRHDGELRWFLSRAIPVRDQEGRIVRWFGTNVDIEEQKRAEAAAAAASRAKDEFLAVLGHELRNPLAPIMTALYLMRARDGERNARERTVIERQAQHLVCLVDDLLDVSRITRGKVELKKRRIEMSEVVASAIETASPLLEQRRHQLVVDVAERGLAVDGDAERLAQVVANLLTNAAKYTEPDGRVEVVAKREGDSVVLRVRDNGIGIAPAMLPHVFDMFVQERQALDRSQGGLGLGLMIVRSLVELHGGSAGVRSDGRNRGAEFIVRLPAWVAKPKSPRAPAEGGGAVAPSPVGRDALRVLVIDDNVDAAELLAASLQMAGHLTRIAYDGPEALRGVAEFSPHVALVDIGLPVIDGYELARRMRQQPGGKAVKLIAVTGYGQDSDRRRSQDAGFDSHLVKPLDMAVLHALLEKTP